MASPFQPYQGGIAPISGISEAGANIGKNIQYGYNAFGNSLAEGIQKYTAGVQENEMIDQEAQGLGMQLKQFHDIFGSNPEYAPFAEQLNQYVDKLSKIPEMSLAQKRGALNSAKVAFSNIGTQLQVFNAMKTMNEERAAAEALRPENNPLTEKKISEATAEGVAINSSEPLLVQRGKYVESLYKKAEENPNIKIDISKALASWDASAKQKLQELQSSGNPYAAVMLEQLDAFTKKKAGEQYRANLAEGQTTDDSMYDLGRMSTPNYTVGAEDLMKMRESSKANQPYVKTQSTEELQYKMAEQSAKVKNEANQIKPVLMDKLNSTLEQIKKEIASGMSPIEFERNLGDFEKSFIGDLDKYAPIAGLNPPIGKSGKERLDEWYKETPEGQALTEILPLWKDAVEKIRAGIGSSGEGDITGRWNTRTKVDFRDIITGKPALPSEFEQEYQRPASEITNKNERIGAISEIQKIQSNINSKKEAIPATKNVTPEDVLASQGISKNQNASLTAPLPELKIGTKTEESYIPQEVRNQKAIDFMTQRLGYRDANGNLVTPASVTKMFSSNQPKSIYTQEGDRIVQWTNPETGKIESHFVAAKEPSMSDIKFQRLSTFGIPNQKTGVLTYEKPVKSLDVAIRGVGDFASPEKAEKFRELLARSAGVVEAMKNVKEIAKEHSIKTKLPWTDARVKIVREQSKAITLMREIMQLDRLSDKDVQLILERIPQNESLWRTASQSTVQADGVIDDIHKMIKNLGDAYRLDVYVPSNSNESLKSSARQEIINQQIKQK